MSTMLQRMLLPENFFDTKVGVRLNSPQSCCSFFSRYPFGTEPSLARTTRRTLFSYLYCRDPASVLLTPQPPTPPLPSRSPRSSPAPPSRPHMWCTRSRCWSTRYGSARSSVSSGTTRRPACTSCVFPHHFPHSAD
jgi:hypothetical protein